MATKAERTIINPNDISEETLIHQSELINLWRKLEEQKRISISRTVNITDGNEMDVKGFRGIGRVVTQYEKAVGLDKGMLLAVKQKYKPAKWQAYDIFALKEDGRFGTEFEDNPIILYADTENKVLPNPIRLETIPLGYRIKWVPEGHNGQYFYDRFSNKYYKRYMQDEVEYVELDEEIVGRTTLTCFSLNRDKGNAIPHNLLRINRI